MGLEYHRWCHSALTVFYPSNLTTSGSYDLVRSTPHGRKFYLPL
jgi:hypothetical protein